MTDAVDPARQDVQQEPADELVGRQRHGAIPLSAIAAVILEAERHPARVERDQPAVGDRNPVRVARQIGQRRRRTRERRLGIDDPGLLANRCQVARPLGPPKENDALRALLWRDPDLMRLIPTSAASQRI